MTLGITSFSKWTVSITIRNATPSVMTESVMLSVIQAKCHVCVYIVMPSVLMLNVNVLSIILLNVIMHSVIILSVIMLR